MAKKKAAEKSKPTATVTENSGPAAANQGNLGTFTLPAMDSPELAHIAPYFRAFAVPVDRLVRDPRNAREHGEGDLPSTAASLKRFGQQHVVHYEPGTRIIKVGNGRHEAAEKILGWKWIAAVPNNLPETELRAFALVDNRTAEKSTWGEGLAAELDALEELGIGLEDVGFSAEDLAEIEKELSDSGEEEADKPAKSKGGSGGGDGGDYQTRFAIIVDCRDEDHQHELLERFRSEGWRVRAQTT